VERILVGDDLPMDEIRRGALQRRLPFRRLEADAGRRPGRRFVQL
jgi:hypothetical protein